MQCVCFRHYTKINTVFRLVDIQSMPIRHPREINVTSWAVMKHDTEIPFVDCYRVSRQLRVLFTAAMIVVYNYL